MSRYYDERREREDDEWEREHEYKLRWQCTQCSYEYECEPGCNEALKCPDCGIKTIQVGESYLG